MRAFIQRLAVTGIDLVGFLLREQTFADQLRRIQRTRAGQVADDLVHHGLGGSRFVGFIVAATAVADEVYNNVFVEVVAVIERKLGDEQYCFGIIAIYVENRCLHHLRNVGAIFSRTHIVLAARREAHLVVDDDMHSTTGEIRTRQRHLESFHHDTLTRKRSVTVDDDRENGLAFRVLAAILPCTNRTFDHRIHDFEVRRVKGHAAVYFAARCHDV